MDNSANADALLSLQSVIFKIAVVVMVLQMMLDRSNRLEFYGYADFDRIISLPDVYQPTAPVEAFYCARLFY